jgi:hypothetical protein
VVFVTALVPSRVRLAFVVGAPTTPVAPRRTGTVNVVVTIGIVTTDVAVRRGKERGRGRGIAVVGGVDRRSGRDGRVTEFRYGADANGHV